MKWSFFKEAKLFRFRTCPQDLLQAQWEKSGFRFFALPTLPVSMKDNPLSDKFYYWQELFLLGQAKIPKEKTYFIGSAIGKWLTIKIHSKSAKYLAQSWSGYVIHCPIFTKIAITIINNKRSAVFCKTAFQVEKDEY